MSAAVRCSSWNFRHLPPRARKHATCAGVPRLAMPNLTLEIGVPRAVRPTSSIARTGSAQVEDSLLPADMPAEQKRKRLHVFVPHRSLTSQASVARRRRAARSPPRRAARTSSSSTSPPSWCGRRRCTPAVQDELRARCTADMHGKPVD
eukprot:COSAG02_NODE_5687_length_4126_cov_2.973429_1_plen_149_part_00